jgi:hypothetical protein
MDLQPPWASMVLHVTLAVLPLVVVRLREHRRPRTPPAGRWNLGLAVVGPIDPTTHHVAQKREKEEASKGHKQPNSGRSKLPLQLS